MTMPTLWQTTPISLPDRDCYCKFLDEKMNCKLSGIDLAAIEAHLLIRLGKCLEITILGWRTKGALPPFLEHWGDYNPPGCSGSAWYNYWLSTA